MKKTRIPLLSLVLTICILLVQIPVSAATYDIDFETTTQAIELINLDTGTVVYQKNADQKMYPTSTTKIMTFIVASEQIPDLENTKITVTEKVVTELLGTGSSLAGVKEGEELTALQLLNCMMIPSGNDAALVLADYVGGGETQKFIDLMNEKAEELGCENTHFMNPHGLHDEQHYTTAEDLYKITKYAMTLPYFMEICSKTYYEIPATNVSPEPRYIYTTNMLIEPNAGGSYYYKYCKGIKTGSHDQAGYCLVSTAVKDGYSYMCIALGAPSVDEQGNRVSTNGAFVDTKNLYIWAFDNLRLKTVLSSDESVCDVSLNLAWNKDKLLLVPEQSYSTILPKDISETSVIITPDVPESIDAPVKKGQVIGTATLSYVGQELATVNLVASESVERSEVLHSVDTMSEVIHSRWFQIIVAVVVVLLLIYMILALIYNRKKKKLRKVKKYRRM
ncbi:MAG: D-alanyl-D-alanine carboxypeptidase [Collinsella tanakaei]|nr:MAG: D-alanyl-D-alanine carboxypeptidase [Collinsella tanakaei]